MLSRRSFLFVALATTSCKSSGMNHRERVDRALKGLDVDRSPFTFYHHFGLEKFPGERHANATLEFHRKFHTDLVKVMSDFPYPKPQGNWYELQPVDNPFPEQIRALEMIRDGLGGKAYFIETVFNPWNVAEKLSSPAQVKQLMAEKPQALIEALDVIATSEAAHARRALKAGAAGIFLAVANAQDGILSQEEYAKFSEPFDKRVLEAVADAPLNTLHLHGEKVYLARFYQGWPASVTQYSAHGTGISIGDFRKNYAGVIMGGLDEVNFRNLTEAQIRQQWRAAQEAAGKRFILAPGCSVPNDSTGQELMRLVNVLRA